MGVTYNAFHVTAVCSPTRAALLTGRNQHRVGFGSIAEYPGPFPGYTAAKPRSCAAFPRILQGERLRHRRLRQVAPDARTTSRARPARSTTGPSRGASTTGGASCPAPLASTTRSSRQDDAVIGVPEGKDGKLYYFPDDITDKAVEWLHARPSAGSRQAMVHVLLDRLRARAAPRAEGVGRQVQGLSSTTAGTSCASARSQRQKELGIVPQDTELTARPDALPGLGLPRRHREEAVRAPDGGLRRLPGERRLERRPAARRDRGDR